MTKEIKPKRRDFLFTATYTVGAVGLGVSIWPLVDQMNPDSSVKALSTTEVDVSGVERAFTEESGFIWSTNGQIAAPKPTAPIV